jgi:tetratricopeptide (TPR) repeat protein
MPTTLGLALIARDAQHSLPALLACIPGAFDQVVLVDTGSSDETVEVFERWAWTEHAHHPNFVSRTAEFAWQDDFAAARNYADALLSTDWRSWADADDEIRGASNLRAIAASAPEDVSAFLAGYRYAETRTGQPIAYVRRHRLVRAGSATWSGRVHEGLVVQGRSLEIPPEEVEWIHRGDLTTHPAESAARNVALLEAWLRDEPSNSEVIRLLGDARLGAEEYEQALDCYTRYLACEPPWGSVRARVHRQTSICLLALGRAQEALTCAEEALRHEPRWTESHLTVAQAELELGNPSRAIEAARTVLDLGPPDTGLVIKPTDYTVVPRMLIARALRALGREQEAEAVVKELLDDWVGPDS